MIAPKGRLLVRQSHFFHDCNKPWTRIEFFEIRICQNKWSQKDLIQNKLEYINGFFVLTYSRLLIRIQNSSYLKNFLRNIDRLKPAWWARCSIEKCSLSRLSSIHLWIFLRNSSSIEDWWSMANELKSNDYWCIKTTIIH